MEVSDKQVKREQRRMKREATRERRYGNPAMMKLAENDPGVRPYYERYKRVKREGAISLIFVALCLLLGVFDIVMILLSQKDSWGFNFGIDFLLALYWLQDFKISEREADLLRHEFVQYADRDAVVKTTKELFRKDDNEPDKAEKVD